MLCHPPIEDDMVALGDDITPTHYLLYRNYPNPSTTIDYDLTKGCSVDLAIFDVMDRRVRTLVFGNQKSGFKSVVWDAKNDFGQPVSTGLYFYTLNTTEGVFTQKMLLLK